MKLIKIVLAILSFTLIASCTVRYTSSIYNVQKAPVVTQSKKVTQEKVGKAVDESGIALGWTMQHIRPGYTIATLHLRSHTAKVGIHYNAVSYSIHYISSKNLTRRGMIHRNYNGWIENLNNAIKRNLLNI
jgi:hypothetical protein